MQGIKEPFIPAVLVYKHETGRCQAEFAHKVNKFGVFGKGRALTKENGKSRLKRLLVLALMSGGEVWLDTRAGLSLCWS